MSLVLRYVGDGAFLHGVPARDLYAADLVALELDADTLVASGLYVAAKADAKRAAGAPANKALTGAVENKEQ